MSTLSSKLRARIAALLAASAATAALVSCGSRTGLFGPDDCPDCAADASSDAPTPVDGRVPCVPGRFTFDLALTQLMFVIDRSGSMAFDLMGRGPTGIPEDEKRWRVLQRGLAGTITAFDQQISMGASFFPDAFANCPEANRSSELACQTSNSVAITPGRGNAQRILRVFDDTAPCGGTPTADAVHTAAQTLTVSRSIARTIVLATDGAPNCNAQLDPATCVCTSPPSQATCNTIGQRGRYSCLDDTRTIETIRTVANVQKIPVYVIGIGSTERPEFLQVLDDMAVAGGRPRATTPRHYSVQSPEDLNVALATIRDSVTKCTYLSPSSPKDPNAVTVEINGVTIPRDQTKANGWDWIDQSFGELAFFGDACKKAQTGTASIVAGVVRCEP
jgi:hypothetical protein